jgi:hypothetical protein
VSKKTRINRPTTATPRKVGTERIIHQSTAFEVVGKDATGKPVIREGKGSTYRKAQG